MKQNDELLNGAAKSESVSRVDVGDFLADRVASEMIYHGSLAQAAVQSRSYGKVPA